MSLLILFFSFMPVIICVTFAGTSLLGIRLKPAVGITIGALVAVIDFFLRDAFLQIGIPPGVDSLLYMLILALAMRLIGKVRWSVAIGATLIGYILIFAGEFLIVPYWLEISGVTNFPALYANPVKFIPWAWVANILVFIGAAVGLLTNFRFIDLSDRQ